VAFVAFGYYDPAAPEQFARLAEHFVAATRRLFGIELRFDRESILKLDGIVDAVGPLENQQLVQDLVMQIGSFLGEALLRVYGGRWTWDERFGTWRVSIPTTSGKDTTPGPFAKVQKRLESGMEDSVSFFAKVTDSMVRGEIPPA